MLLFSLIKLNKQNSHNSRGFAPFTFVWRGGKTQAKVSKVTKLQLSKCRTETRLQQFRGLENNSAKTESQKKNQEWQSAFTTMTFMLFSKDYFFICF